MNLSFKRERYTAKLPATPCTPHMRQKMQALASSEGVKLAEIQRYAVELFLQEYDRKADMNWQESQQKTPDNLVAKGEQ